MRPIDFNTPRQKVEYMKVIQLDPAITTAQENKVNYKAFPCRCGWSTNSLGRYRRHMKRGCIAYEPNGEPRF